jgi:hypothetical protein
MPTKKFVAIAIFCVTLVILIVFGESARTQNIPDLNLAEARPKNAPVKPNRVSQMINFSPEINNFAPVAGCEVKPPANPSLPAKLTQIPISLERFRKPVPVLANPETETVAEPTTKEKLPAAASKQPAYSPREVIALAANSNYGDRYLTDLKGNPANLQPIIVLHETVGSANSVINYFQAFQSNEDNQASYHTMIALDGTVIYFVPPDKRAFGAGNSVFVSGNAKEAIQTNPKYPSSVNNFAYHISLETPPNGIHNGRTHGGYTDLQYQSLAWLVAKTDVPLERITTHRDIDRSGSRIDPRSFNNALFQKLLSEYPRTKEIAIGCMTPVNPVTPVENFKS